MRYTKRIAILLLSLVFVAGVYVSSASAQVRGYRRAYVVRPYYWNDPFWRGSRWGYDPFWSDPYWTDPYYREQRDRYYKEKDVKDAARKLSKDREKYGSDGYLDPKEQEKLAKRVRDYNKAREKLAKFNREH